MKNIRTDGEIELGCTEFLQAMENRVKVLESEIVDKLNSE